MDKEKLISLLWELIEKVGEDHSDPEMLAAFAILNGIQGSLLAEFTREMYEHLLPFLEMQRDMLESEISATRN